LLLADTMYFTYSRMGLVDIFLTVLTMATMLAFAWYLKRPFERARIPLLVTGLLMGMAIATKWSAAYGGFFIGLVVIWRFARAWRASRAGDATPDLRRAVRDHLLLGPLALVGFPVAIYLGAYLPFFISGNNGWDDFVDLQRAILRLQTTLDDDPRTASPWWTWPFDWRSVWFGTRSLADGRVAKTYALGNPFIYWAMLPAVAWTLLRWWRERRTLAFTVLAVGFFGQWLPWMLVDRSMYLYHFLPAVPFGALAIAASLVHLMERWRDWRRVMAIQYAGGVVLAFAFFYPIASYYPISERAMGLRMWLASWV
jgi:dolichyl-phosphate-mannose--protein O-mannosyl transferase